MSIFSREADMTYLAWGGLLIALVVVIGLMILHNADTEKDLLSPEHIMAIIGLPTVILSYAVGKKVGEATANGKKENTDDKI